MPRQRSRSPLSPILATESATVRLFFILSVLLCSVNKAGLKTETWLLYCLRLRSRSPHNAKHSTSYDVLSTRPLFSYVNFAIITRMRAQCVGLPSPPRRPGNEASKYSAREERTFSRTCPGYCAGIASNMPVSRSA